MTVKERLTYVVAGLMAIVVCVSLLTGTWEGLISILVAIAGILGMVFLPPKRGSKVVQPDPLAP
jgi:hypothetical protein